MCYLVCNEITYKEDMFLCPQHDGLEKKHAWFLEKIDITDMQTTQTWTFSCRNWLSLHIKDYRIKRDLIGRTEEKVQEGMSLRLNIV